MPFSMSPAMGYTVSMTKSVFGNRELEVRGAKVLGMADQSDRFRAVWECLVDDGIVADWERGAATDEDIREDARRVLHHFDILEGRASSTRQKAESRAVVEVPVEPTERERDMTDALRIYFAAHAAQRPLVQRFRREYLPHGLLRRDEEISAFLSAELGGEVTVEDYLDYPEGKPADTVPLLLDSKPPQRVTCGVYTQEELASMRASEVQKQEEKMERDWNWYWLMGEEFQTIAKWLFDQYPWSIGDAEVFLISGRPPRLAEPLRATQDDANAAYSITFSPWISEETVVRAYRNIQSLHRRPPGDKTLRVLHFVSGQADDEGVLPSWSTLYDRWNAANPEDRFEDRSALYKAYRRAVKALVPPSLPLT
jgi:hypothetical protein